MADVPIVATSNAADLGYVALADLAAAAQGIEYRVVGGHMVQLLLHVFPAPDAHARFTADADAGVDRVAAVAAALQHGLIDRGYSADSGNRYTKPAGKDGQQLAVDVLVPYGEVGDPVILGGRGFDAIPGLSLALVAKPIVVSADVRLRNGQRLLLTVPIPGVEAALVLKALAWNARTSPKDLTDIFNLLEITDAHRQSIGHWRLDDPTAISRGSLCEAAVALYRMVDLIDRGQLISRQPESNPLAGGADSSVHRRRPRPYSHHQYRRPSHPPLDEIGQRAVRGVERIRRRAQLDSVFPGEGEELARVVAGVGGDRTQRALLEQVPLIVQRRDVGEVDARERQRAAPVQRRQRRQHQFADRREQDRRVQRHRRRVGGALHRRRAESRASSRAPRRGSSRAPRRPAPTRPVR